MTLFSVLLEALVRHHDESRARAAMVSRRRFEDRAHGAPAALVSVRVGLLTLLLALIPACAAVGPVDIDTAADVCARCRMAIDSLAHAGEIVTSEGDVRKYDSLGCLLGDHRDLAAAGRRLAGAWVMDHETKKWLKAEDAHYALVDLPTDHMGFGAVATATRDAALKIAGGNAAKVANWQGLLQAR